MGKFRSIADADAYAKKYHEDAEAGKFGSFQGGRAYRLTKGGQTLDATDLSDDDIKKLKAKGYSVERSQ
jgi:hypothetical protein